MRLLVGVRYRPLLFRLRLQLSSVIVTVTVTVVVRHHYHHLVRNYIDKFVFYLLIQCRRAIGWINIINISLGRVTIRLIRRRSYRAVVIKSSIKWFILNHLLWRSFFQRNFCLFVISFWEDYRYLVDHLLN